MAWCEDSRVDFGLALDARIVEKIMLARASPAGGAAKRQPRAPADRLVFRRIGTEAVRNET
jgi:hypothetical protein